ncbi:MAG: hypothetical protein SGI92_08345 [Bryobacteraceae bacterium]|nr:hypothetical protein [Bryobacteraceae bacterium]
MTRRLLSSILGAVAAAPAQVRPEHPEAREDPKLPDGTSQKEAILKADFAQSLKDADALIKMAEDLKIDLEKNDRHVLSLATLKKLDEIDKMTKRIRGRLKRF